MKFTSIIAFIFLLICQTLFAQVEINENAKHKVLVAQEARFSAMINADTESLHALLADELSYSHTTGWTETKSEFLSTIETNKIDYLKVDSRNPEVRIYDDTAVITGLADVKVTVGGEQKEFTIRFLEVCRRHNNSWQLVAWQSVKNLSN